MALSLGLNNKLGAFRTASFITYGTPEMPGVVSSADPDTLVDATLTSGNLWNYFVDFDGTGTRGLIKRRISTDGGLTWGSNVVIADRSTEVTPTNLETPTIMFDGTTVWMYALEYETSNTDAANPLVVWYGDGTTMTYAGAVIAANNITADSGYVMEPEAISNGADEDVFYTGADLVTTPGLSICYATSTDAFTFSGHAVLLQCGSAPAGAFYHGGASPSVIQLPDTTWLMAFTGIDASFANVGGITLARTSGSDPSTGWTFGTKVLFGAYNAGGQAVSLVTGADLSHDAAAGTITIRHSAVVGATIKMGTATMPLADALAAAGL